MMDEVRPAPEAQAAEADTRASWLPLAVIALAQALLSFNVVALPVSIGGIVKSFNAPATIVANAVVAYSLAVAGLVMVGAKIGQRFGVRRMFRGVLLVFGGAMLLMALSPSAVVMVGAQGLAGVAAAVMVPSLVVLIANNYHGRQQTTALGALGSAGAAGAVSAFVIGGSLVTLVGWRPVWGLLTLLSVAAYALTSRLRPDRGMAHVRIDIVGAVLSVAAIALISAGCNGLSDWGAGIAKANAPFSLFGISPAPFMIMIGIALGQLFITWSRRQERLGRTPLLAVAVGRSGRERAALYAMFAIVGLEAALNFSMPLYIQIVQGRSALSSAIAMMPFNISVLVSALAVVRLYEMLAPRNIGRLGFAFSSVALLWLAFTVHNDWGKLPVMAGLAVFGLGQGAIVTVVFSVLVTASPKALSGDVGALRGTAGNLAAAVGTALAGAIMIGMLASSIEYYISDNPNLTPELKQQVNLDDVTFVSDAQLLEVMSTTTATPAQVEEAIRINTDARLEALRGTLLLMAGLALLAIYPAGRLPGFKPGEVPESPVGTDTSDPPPGSGDPVRPDEAHGAVT